MRSFKILQDGIMAVSSDYEDLKKAEKAKVLLVSDTHGGTLLFSRVIKQKGRECDALVFTGDGAADLVKMIDSEELSAYLPKVIIYVRGNNDFGEYESEKAASVYFPSKVECVIANKKVLVTHGHEEGVYYGEARLIERAKRAGVEAAFYGHSHVPFEGNGEVKAINCGSLNYPRRGSPKSFAVVSFVQREITCTFYTFTGNGECVTYIPPLYL